jgi:gamma-polyglutamate biosynthesis protein CapC
VDFVLELLPARGLDQSMLLPVLVGVLVVLLFTEIFGWVFAGAIVPGYLASVLIIQPVTGAVVIFESLVSLAVAAALAKLLSRTDAWSRFFGRERFFLILAVSLLVRIHDHAWFAPWAVARIDAVFGVGLELQQEFYSIGLVLVPLTANMLWKPALHRGVLQLGVQVALTYAIVAYLLLPYTNLSLSSIELTYEHAAVDFIGHAKAYMILLTTALVAAQLNLTYGWDFNGILVPALLALLWLTPLKLLATVSEAVVVFYLVKGFVRLPVIRHLDFAGPRKLALVFTLAFVWKLALGFALAALVPEFKISDAYGFGYLLSSLLATKMLARASVRGVLLPSLTASAAGFLIGSMAGFVLDIVAPEPPPSASITRPASQRLASTPLGVMSLARMQIEAQAVDLGPPTHAELRSLQMFWSGLASLDAAEDSAESTALRRRAAALGLQIVELGRVSSGSGERAEAREWLAVVERDGPQRRGFVTGLVIPQASGPVLVVPMPMSEAPVAEAAAVACRRVDCRAVLVAGRELSGAGTRINPRPLDVAVEAFAAKQVVVLRATQRTMPGEGIIARFARRSWMPAPARARLELDEPSSSPTRVHVLRGRFELVELWPEDYELDWAPREPLIRPPSGDGNLVVLEAARERYEALVLAGAPELAGLAGLVDTAPAAGGSYAGSRLVPILAEMYADREPPGFAGAGYQPPSKAELLLLEQDVVAPLVDWAQSSGPGEPPPARVALAAALLDYELVEFGDCRAVPADHEVPPCSIMLRERGGSRPSTAGWGTLIVRRDPRALALIVEVPRPHREAQTWRVAVELWQLSRASTLLIAGADGLAKHPRAAGKPTAGSHEPGSIGPPDPDPVRQGNLDTPFQAFHQAIERSSVRGEVREVLQVRGLASYRTVDRDLILGLGQPGRAEQLDEACWAALDPRIAALVGSWGGCRIADGSEDLYLLSGAGTPQLEYSRELRSREVRVLWLSAGLRQRFAADRGFVELRGLRQAGFAVEPRHELDALLQPIEPIARGAAGRVHVDEQGFAAAVELAREFAELGNLHLLRELEALHRASANLRIEAAFGEDWGRAFLLIERVGEVSGERALVVLDPALDRRVELSVDELVGDALARLQLAALIRPQVLVLSDLRLAGGLP